MTDQERELVNSNLVDVLNLIEKYPQFKDEYDLIQDALINLLYVEDDEA